MTIKFLGHACFLLVADDGTRVIIDPYEPGAFGNALNYGPITDEADLVLVTHDHADHSYVRGVPGSPQVCRTTCTAKGMDITAVTAPHDDDAGGKRGQIEMFVVELDGLRICHVGDLGDQLTARQVAALGRVDVLMVPVGGTFTLDAAGAWKVVESIDPRVVIPMHYKTSRTSLPLAPLDPFTAGKAGVEKLGGSTVELAADSLGDARRIVVLQPAN